MYGKRLALRFIPHSPTKKIKIYLRELIKPLIKPFKYPTLKLEGYLMGESILTLIDDGTINNFINEAFILGKNLESVENQEFRVTNARGYRTICKWMVRDLKLTIGNYTIIEDFYIYPKNFSSHIVLGFQWLYKLGDTPSITRS